MKQALYVVTASPHALLGTRIPQHLETLSHDCTRFPQDSDPLDSPRLYVFSVVGQKFKSAHILDLKEGVPFAFRQEIPYVDPLTGIEEVKTCQEWLHHYTTPLDKLDLLIGQATDLETSFYQRTGDHYLKRRYVLSKTPRVHFRLTLSSDEEGDSADIEWVIRDKESNFAFTHHSEVPINLKNLPESRNLILHQNKITLDMAFEAFLLQKPLLQHLTNGIFDRFNPETSPFIGGTCSIKGNHS